MTTFVPKYSHLAGRISSSDSDGWEVSDKAKKLLREGEDIILLCVGDPDFRTPEPIIDNAVSYLRVDRTHYSPALGELKLRRAVADLESRTSPHPCTVDEVAIFPGATSSLHAVMTCLLNAGDEVIIPEPMYVGYQPIMNAIDAKVVSVPLDVKSGFDLDLPAIKAAFTPATRVLFLNTPGNPTGSIIPAAQLRELGEYCRARNVWLVCDEVYSMFTYEGRHRSARASVKELDNVIMVDGLSKSHAMSGWRVGWAVAPETMIERLGAYATTTLFGCPQFIQDASAFALENDQAYVEQMREQYRERRDFVLAKLSPVNAITCHTPMAGMFIMCDVSATGLDGDQFAHKLLDAQGVSVVPGSAFGPSASACIRIGLAQNLALLQKACERIVRFCETL
ncbi:UNVERIFIED_CONTAM: hypothetical protein GTU68_034993 [Idotea baltica]|nr:hypothetical protein [Idotea baltica]